LGPGILSKGAGSTDDDAFAGGFLWVRGVERETIGGRGHGGPRTCKPRVILVFGGGGEQKGRGTKGVALKNLFAVKTKGSGSVC